LSTSELPRNGQHEAIQRKSQICDYASFVGEATSRSYIWSGETGRLTKLEWPKRRPATQPFRLSAKRITC